MVLPEVGCGRLWGAGAAKLGAVGPAAASEPPGLSLQTWPASGCPPPAPARTHASTHAPACGQRTECAQPKSVWAAWARRGRCCARLRSPLGAPAGPSLPGRSLHMQVMPKFSGRRAPMFKDATNSVQCFPLGLRPQGHGGTHSRDREQPGLSYPATQMHRSHLPGPWPPPVPYSRPAPPPLPLGPTN